MHGVSVAGLGGMGGAAAYELAGCLASTLGRQPRCRRRAAQER
jgi:hypothetical protein